MSEMINVKIDNIPVTVEKGTTILDAARIAGVKIPTSVSYTHLTLPTT